MSADSEVTLIHQKTNKLSDKFEKDIYETMSNVSVFKVLAVNSILAIYSKMFLDVYDIITLSYIGFLPGNNLQPYFVAGFVQNVIFRGTGYGLARTANMYASRYFGEGKYDHIGITINHGRICTTVFFLLTLLFSFFSGPIINLLFSGVDSDLVTTFLVHNSPTIFLNFQIYLLLIYLNSQNHYIAPTVIDSLTAVVQYFIFWIIFAIYKDYNLSVWMVLVLTAWSLNLTNLFQFICYYGFIICYSPESLLYVTKSSFKGILTYLFHSIDFIFFFLSHFLANEQLTVLIGVYYGGGAVVFNAYNSASKIYYLVQKISYGFTSVLMSLTGTLVKKGYFELLKKFTNLYFLLSYSVIVLGLVLIEVCAGIVAKFITNKQELLDYIPTFIRLLVPCVLPFHMEMSLQSIISGYGKQKGLAYSSMALIIVFGFLLGYVFMFLCDFAIYGVYITSFILEVILTGLSIYFYKKLK
jgi:Na+-driven multidrug efflux pump